MSMHVAMAEYVVSRLDKLSPQDGDILVVTTARRLTDEEHHRFHHALQAHIQRTHPAVCPFTLFMVAGETVEMWRDADLARIGLQRIPKEPTNG